LSVVVVLSVVGVLSVVVVLSVVPVAEYSSLSSLQEIMVRLKQEIRVMNKTFFIFSSIPKLKSYWLREPYLYQNLDCFTMCGGFTLRVVNMDFIVEERTNKPSTLTDCFTSP